MFDGLVAVSSVGNASVLEVFEVGLVGGSDLLLGSRGLSETFGAANTELSAVFS